MKKIAFLISCGLLLLFASCSSTDTPTPKSNDVSCEALHFIEPEPDSLLVNSYEVTRIAEYVAKKVGITNVMTRNNESQIIKDSKGQAIAYVVNFTGNSGYVIISATKQLSPILAFSESGYFDIENIKGPIEMWISNLPTENGNWDKLENKSKKELCLQWKQFERVNVPIFHQSRDGQPGHGTMPQEDHDIIHPIMKDSLMLWHHKNYDVYTLDELELYMPDKYEEFDKMVQDAIWPEYIDAYKDLTVVIVRYDGITTGGHLIKTAWHQQMPYNQSYGLVYNGNGESKRAYAGCAPVAIGQILYYYKFPTFKNWDGMVGLNGERSISDLLYEIAELGNAQYSWNETMLDTEHAEAVFKHYGYGVGHASNNIKTKAIESLNKNKLVYLANQMMEKSFNEEDKPMHHAYILDGCRTFTTITSYEIWSCPNKKKFEEIYKEETYSDSAPLYHINWGAEENYNGYYSNFLNAVPNNNYYDGNVVRILYDIAPR